MPQPHSRRPRPPLQRDVTMRKSWHGVSEPGGGRRYRAQASSVASYTWLMLIVFAATLGWLNRDVVLPAIGAHGPGFGTEPQSEWAPDVAETSTDTLRITFSLCHTGGGRNCVVDGDTFWLNGEKIRIADIDTPETHPPGCAAEAALGGQATQRLRALLNAGPISLAANPGGDSVDRYGRRLAVVERDGQSIGMMLVSEGLARPYAGGQRAGWC